MSKRINMAISFNFTLRLMVNEVLRGADVFDYDKWASYLNDEAQISDEKVNQRIIRGLIDAGYLEQREGKYYYNREKFLKDQKTIEDFSGKGKKGLEGIQDYEYYISDEKKIDFERIFKGLLLKLDEYYCYFFNINTFLKNCEKEGIHFSFTNFQKGVEQLMAENWLIGDGVIKQINIPVMPMKRNEILNSYSPEEYKVFKHLADVYTGEEIHLIDIRHKNGR